VRNPRVEGQSVGTLAARIADGSVSQAVVVHDTAGKVSLSKVTLNPADRSTLLHLSLGAAPTTARLSSLSDYRL